MRYLPVLRPDPVHLNKRLQVVTVNRIHRVRWDDEDGERKRRHPHAQRPFS
jgi:hypothetical protein